MKNYLVLFLAFSLCQISIAQNSEFKVHPNGLIYSKNTMDQLSNIVDSLNLKHKTCDVDPIFYAKHQSIGHLINLEGGNIKAIKKDLENNISYQAFKAKYPKVFVQENNLFIRTKYKSNTEDSVFLVFSEINLKSGYGHEISVEDTPTKNSKWIWNHQEKTAYSDESIVAFYLPKAFQSIAIPSKYSRMIGYADCLIDTTTTKLKEEMEEGWVGLPQNWSDLPEQKKVKLLDKLRGTQVIGFCSQDNRPRQHAVNIAMLSAETTNWEVFLKAHLDIMNDRFERMSDGNYAWAGRKTYIKELDELGINVSDLMLGICLRFENPAKNHYHGSIARIGRALSEINSKETIENELLSMIEDENLDAYNRVLAYFLFDNYLYYIEDQEDKKAKKERLKIATSNLPTYLSEKID